jgi:hypothetical protein
MVGVVDVLRGRGVVGVVVTADGVPARRVVAAEPPAAVDLAFVLAQVDQDADDVRTEP